MHDTTYRISIIIPAYNVEKYIDDCIQSVISQNYKNFEIVLIDDGSTDRTGDICDKYVCDNVHVFHKKNGGLSDARNHGLSYAKGEYVVFLDSDDYWDDNDFLRKINELINVGHSDIIVFGYKKLCSGKVISAYNPNSFASDSIQLMKDNAFNICAWDKVIKREVLVDNSIEFKKGVFSEDMEWCAKVFASISSCTVLNETPYIYRQRKGSISNNITPKNIDDILENYKACLALEKKLRLVQREVYEIYLSKNLSMMIIAMAECTEKLDKDYDAFVMDNLNVLKSSSRGREKIIYYSIRFAGIKNTKAFLRVMKKAKKK